MCRVLLCLLMVNFVLMCCGDIPPDIKEYCDSLAERASDMNRRNTERMRMKLERMDRQMTAISHTLASHWDRLASQHGLLAKYAEIAADYTTRVSNLEKRVENFEARIEQIQVDQKWFTVHIRTMNNNSAALRRGIKRMDQVIKSLYIDHGEFYRNDERIGTDVEATKMRLVELEGQENLLQQSVQEVMLKQSKYGALDNVSDLLMDVLNTTDGHQTQIDSISMEIQQIKDELGDMNDNFGEVKDQLSNGERNLRSLSMKDFEKRIVKLEEALIVREGEDERDTTRRLMSSTTEHNDVIDNRDIESATQNFLPTQPTIKFRHTTVSNRLPTYENTFKSSQDDINEITNEISNVGDSFDNEIDGSEFDPMLPVDNSVEIDNTITGDFSPMFDLHPNDEDVCSLRNIEVGSPRTVAIIRRTPTGAWMRDPKSRRGTIYVADNHFKVNRIRTFKSERDIADGNDASNLTLPFRCTGTGHVVYNGSLYCNKFMSNKIIRYDLSTHKTTSRRLQNARFNNTAPYLKNNHDDIDFSVDEIGLWVIFSTNGNISVAIVDSQTLSIRQEWSTNIQKRKQVNAFMICGRLYTVRKDQRSVNIRSVFDTRTDHARRLDIAIMTPTTDISMLHYNPRDSKLYAWVEDENQNGQLVLYDVYFKE